MMRILKWISIPLVAFSMFVMPGCVVQKNPISGQRRAYGYSWEEEKRIGREADQQIQQQYGLYDDPRLSDYVKEVGQAVLEVSHMRREDTDPRYKNTEFHFRLLNSPVVNAFALPGGYVYVTRGLMSHLNNEAQLAVVLGHEIGHVAARHASQRAFEQKLGQVALIGGAVAGQELLGLPGGSLLDLGSTAAQMLFLQYGRDDERESDRLGVEYAAMQHYEAAEGAAFFTSLKRMSEKSGQSIPSFLSTHPEPGEREQTIPKLARQWEEKGYSQTRVDKDQYMNAIDGMIYGDNPREGFTREQTFYHPDLKFLFPYPAGWRVVNEASRVLIANEEGNAVVILQVDSESSGARASARKFLEQEGITVTSQSSALNNGLQAYQATAGATTQNGTELGIYVYALEYGDQVYRFVSYTTADRFGQYRSSFEQAATGFRELDDPEILGVDPVRLRVMQADRSGNFSSFLPQNLPMDITEEELAIVNQVHLDTRIERGTYLKLPRQ